jgi:hypothetical protein
MKEKSLGLFPMMLAATARGLPAFVKLMILVVLEPTLWEPNESALGCDGDGLSSGAAGDDNALAVARVINDGERG